MQAAEKAIANPLLDEISLHGAKGVLINITGGYDLTLFELDEAANIIREKVDPDANIIVGSTLDTSMEGAIRVSVVATGIDAIASNRAEAPVARRSMASAPLPRLCRRRAAAPRADSAEPRREAPVQEAPADEEPTPVRCACARTRPRTSSSKRLDSDDLPPPAYRPQAAAAADAGIAPAACDDRGRSDGLRAPRAAPDRPAFARGAGPPAGRRRASCRCALQPPLRLPAAAAPAAAAPRAAEKPRFGIGSLINRMAGHPEPQRTARPAAAPRQQPPVTAYDDEPELSADQDRIEIPAFLRRQAN